MYVVTRRELMVAGAALLGLPRTARAINTNAHAHDFDRGDATRLASMAAEELFNAMTVPFTLSDQPMAHSNMRPLADDYRVGFMVSDPHWTMELMREKFLRACAKAIDWEFRGANLVTFHQPTFQTSPTVRQSFATVGHQANQNGITQQVGVLVATYFDMDPMIQAQVVNLYVFAEAHR